MAIDYRLTFEDRPNRPATGSKFRFCLLCLMVLPFGQLIPLLLWSHTKVHFPPARWLAKKMIRFMATKQFRGEMDQNPLSLEEYYPSIGNGNGDENDDPLREYLKKKTMTHAGFVLESLVESGPQSILQMVAIVVTGQVSGLSIFSIIVSIVSISSKGFLLSYSIHRPTFVLNFVCYVVDVFLVFAEISWVFYNPYHIASLLWFGKIIVVAAVIVLDILYFGVVALASLIFCPPPSSGYERPNKWLEAVQVAGAVVGGVLVFGPAMVALNAFKLSLVPLAVSRSLSDSYGSEAMTFSRIFKWLSRGRKDGTFKARLFAMNQIVVRTTWGGMQDRLSDLTLASPLLYISHAQNTGGDGITVGQFQKLNQQRLAEYLIVDCGDDPELYTFAGQREASGLTLAGFAKALVKKTSHEMRISQDLRDKFLVLGMFFYWFFIAPLIVLGNAYGLIFPLLMTTLVWTREDARADDPNKPITLQLFLTGVVTTGILIILALLPWMLKFKHLSSHLLFRNWRAAGGRVALENRLEAAQRLFEARQAGEDEEEDAQDIMAAAALGAGAGTAIPDRTHGLAWIARPWDDIRQFRAHWEVAAETLRTMERAIRRNMAMEQQFVASMAAATAAATAANSTGDGTGDEEVGGESGEVLDNGDVLYAVVTGGGGGGGGGGSDAGSVVSGSGRDEDSSYGSDDELAVKMDDIFYGVGRADTGAGAVDAVDGVDDDAPGAVDEVESSSCDDADNSMV